MAKKPKKSAEQQQRERIYKGLRSWLMPPNPQPARVINITEAPSRHVATRARLRHAQLATARIGADPRLV
jgi:hypothetical protein